MHRTIHVLGLAVAATAVATLAVPAASASEIPGGRPLVTALSGANEVQAADPDGSGTAMVTVNPGTNEICYALSVSDLDPVIGAHIHVAPAGVNGPIVVHLAAPVTGTSSGCTTVSRELARAITMMPSEYYVNVHTVVYPAGAVRGQLG